MLPESDPRSGTELNRRTEGLDVRKNPSSKKEGKVFFLDIPFYRTRISSSRRTEIREQTM